MTTEYEPVTVPRDPQNKEYVKSFSIDEISSEEANQVSTFPVVWRTNRVTK